jgi:amino acid adenylation domain-containing protein
MRSPSTFVEVLQGHAAHRPARKAYTFLQGDVQTGVLTYEALDVRARAIAAMLQGERLEGQRVLLLYAPGLQFIEAFLGCLYAGAIAVPAYPPEPGLLKRSLPRFRAIVEDAQADAVLTVGPILALLEAARSQLSDLRQLKWLTGDQVGDAQASSWRRPDIDGDSLAFLQYTSGSTSAPKGVMVSHCNILTNERVIQKAFGHTSESVITGWLPFYHDMGLIGNILQPAFLGSSCYLMSPMEFLRRPLAWIRTISTHCAETSGGPNFAYDLCVRKLEGAGDLDLDLSSWRVAFNGSEPIRPATLRRFAHAFAPYGFDQRAFLPCYGLAESTLFVTGARRGEGAAIRGFEVDALQHGTAVPATAEGEPHALRRPVAEPAQRRELVGCGGTFGGHECRIVDPESSLPAPDGTVGEVWVAGPSVVSGYWRRPEDTKETFGATLATGDGKTYLRTGDLGFMHGHELFVTGRRKDLIIVRGRNHYPQDVEETVHTAYPGLRPGCCAAFSVDGDGEERLVVAQEVGASFDGNAAEAAAAIRRAIVETHELQTQAVVLLKHGTLPKTSSGKIQRRACRDGYLTGTLDAVAHIVQGNADADESSVDLPGLDDLSTLSAGERQERIRRFVLTLATRTLSVPAGSLDATRPLAEQGLDSLRAIELKHEIDARFGTDLSIAELLGGMSIAQLAARMERCEPTTASASPAEASRTEFDLSYGQRALWYLHQLAPESVAYNICVAVRLQPAPDLAALGHAFATLLERHPALRTTYATRDGVPYQRIGRPTDFALEVQDAGGWDEQTLADRLDTDAFQPFALEHGPILRATLFTRGSTGAVLLIAVHHIAADFWSLETVATELGQLYEAAAAERRCDLSTASGTYETFVTWQAELLASGKGAAHLRYWSNELSDAPTVLAIPSDKARPASPTYRGASVSFAVPGSIAQGLRDLAEREGVSLFTVLLAAYQVLLSKYSMQDDVLVGVPMAGRRRKEFAPLVGYFVNPVVLRGRLADNPTFVGYLQQTRRTVADALEHQDVPFPLLVERLRPTRDAGRSPFFQAMFSLQQARDQAVGAVALGALGDRLHWETLTLEGYPMPRRIAQFDLTLQVAEIGDRLIGSLEYAEDLFEAETPQRMTEQFGVLLRSLVANPTTRVKSLSLVSADEAATQIDIWNRTERTYAPAATVVELWQRQVTAHPEGLALVGGEVRLTYHELDQRASAMAQRLHAVGVGAGDRVALFVSRSIEMIVAVLGVLKVGAIYVPLDLRTPKQRIAYVVQDCAAAGLLTSTALLDRLPPLDCPIHCVGEESGVTPSPATAVVCPAGPESAAYVIYTSGTTGQPKGVVVLHRNVVHYVQSAAEAYGIGRSDRVLQFASLAFDVSVEEIFTTLTSGGTLVLRDDAMLESASIFLSRCGALGITVLDLPTAYWHELVASATADDWRQATALRVVLIAGEKANVEPLRRWHQNVGSRVQLLNRYGPTEATIIATVEDLTQLTGLELATMTEVSIGRPYPNCQAYILDTDLKPVPAGAPGELYIGGAGVADGYLNAPELTASRFLPDPFASRPGARLYRTGDKVRYLPGGAIQYLGRLDRQIKIRGHRVELGEIESVLAEYPGLRAVAVALDAAAASEPRVIAYLECEQPSCLSVAAVRAFVKERLPHYAVPAVFVGLTALPLSSSGKINRNLLPRPSVDNTLRDDTHVSPSTPLEARMTEVWKRVLKIDQVGIHDNFFDVGGHSLLLPVLLSEIRREFQRDVAMVTLLERPTIRASAALFGDADEGGDLAVERGRTRASRVREMTRRQARSKVSKVPHESITDHRV